MARPNWKAKHLTTASQFPDKPTRGRAYFIDDEGVIKIDHGQGVITYGARPGPPGPPGSPRDDLQEQLFDLEEASLRVIGLVHDYAIRKSAETRQNADIEDLNYAVLVMMNLFYEHMNKEGNNG